MEAVSQLERTKGVKRDISEITHRIFIDIDMEDSYKRAKERNSRRQDFVEMDPSNIHEDDDESLNDYSEKPYDEEHFKTAFGGVASKRSLRRMSHHKMDS